MPEAPSKHLWQRYFTSRVESHMADRGVKPGQASKLAVEETIEEWRSRFPDLDPPTWIPEE